MAITKKHWGVYEWTIAAGFEKSIQSLQPFLH
jgi:hypothetical protein